MDEDAFAAFDGLDDIREAAKGKSTQIIVDLGVDDAGESWGKLRLRAGGKESGTQLDPIARAAFAMVMVDVMGTHEPEYTIDSEELA